MEFRDDELRHFEEHGDAPLAAPDASGDIDHDGARIHFAAYGSGEPVVLLHGGLGHGGNWGYQVPPLIAAGRRVILVDSRGHGRSTRDSRPYTYELMSSDVLAVMDALGLAKAAFVGWSDGACVALILAMWAPARVAGVFFFACNMDPSGVRDIGEPGRVIQRCFNRHAKDFALLSPTPGDFKSLVADVSAMMRTQPNYGRRDLAAIRVPVGVALGEHDEFIKPEHAAYLARSIPGAELIELHGVSHFAPLQRPELFNGAMLAFLAKTKD
ncbi:MULTISPECIES: alpha/beta hydrolase [unclassified Bradyrhizobium]|uniref:alpha/beta fold hydrolase n=1 Tax=unclassified Bradyrhizobium TaxID=2631580 RepID=UPI0028E59EFD|nr:MULTISPECIES: alpha/beta hydrolase [unclassified Bradyrhizobium]